MNLVRPTLCAAFALAALACTPAALALDLPRLPVPSLTPSLPVIPSAPQAQPMPAAAPARAVRACRNADDDTFFHPSPCVPTTVDMSGDDDGCIPRPVKPVRPHFDPQDGDGSVVDLRGLDTDKPVKLLR